MPGGPVATWCSSHAGPGLVARGTVGRPHGFSGGARVRQVETLFPSAQTAEPWTVGRDWIKYAVAPGSRGRETSPPKRNKQRQIRSQVPRMR